MNVLTKKILIILILIIACLFIIFKNKENCFLCDGYGKLPCAVCIKGNLGKEVCQFCDGNGQSICSMCNGTGIELKKEIK